MDALLIAFAAAIAAFLIPLMVVVRGIRRQERLGLTRRDAGPCAAFTRKLLGLSGSLEEVAAGPVAAAPPRRPAPEPARRSPARPAALATGARS